MEKEKANDRAQHPLFARFYARISPAMDRGGVVDHRRRLLAGLSGEVLEVGAGNGLNFMHYPPEVTRVVAVEPERRLREIALANAERAPVRVEVVDGIAERLPADDAAFDAGVASLVLCSVNDQAVALRELRRVIRPGGHLRFLEHVRAQTRGLARLQRVADATLWPLLMGGCHTHRDTAEAIVAAGFEIEQIDRFLFPEGRFPPPTAPNILGVARRN
jgi:ubiquinone/menaquinone biosynthesis C-methylase UbiE